MKIKLFSFSENSPLNGWAKNSTPFEIGINVHPIKPVWRQRLALMHEILHCIEYEIGIKEDHLILHYVAIFLVLCVSMCSTTFLTEDFTLMFKLKTKFSDLHFLETVEMYKSILKRITDVTNENL